AVGEATTLGLLGRGVKMACSHTAGPSSYAGTESKNLVTAQYSASMRVPAGTQRYAGTSNRRPRSIIRRRDSGIGETPNSIPRVSVVPFHGGSVRLWFSSQIPIHGKSPGFQTYPNASRDAGEKATKNARSSTRSIRCAVYAL